MVCVSAPQAPAPVRAEPRVLYLIGETTPMHAAPDRRAPVLSRLAVFDIVTGFEEVPGWLHVNASTGQASELGWIQILAEHTVKGTLEAMKYRLFRAQHTEWPKSVRLAVVRGQIRRGFTGDQVKLALGDPVRKDLRRTGDDVNEEWLYADKRVIFSHEGVAAIERLTSK
jgi:hypothetical protein